MPPGPCRSGPVDRQEGDGRVFASRGQVLPRAGNRYHGHRGALSSASDSLFIQVLYILLAIILLHDIFAPHPFALHMILSNGDLSVQSPDEGHPATAEFVEDDVKLPMSLHPSFHQLLLISKDERPPKA
jgi:hypothetical protein